MHTITLPKTVLLGLVLTLLLIAFSADSCDSYKTRTDYRTMAWNDALNAGIPPQLFVNQIQWESGFNPNARGGSGEIGIAQFMPQTARGLSINAYDPVDSLRGAAGLMGRYYARYGYTYDKALAAYNAGSGTVDNAVLYWNWKAHIPASTVRYIHAIMGY